jgi:hypothetical protein
METLRAKAEPGLLRRYSDWAVDQTLRTWRFDSRQEEIFALFHSVWTGSEAYPALYSTGFSNCFSGSNAADVCSCIFSSPYIFMAWYLFRHKDSFTFLPILYKKKTTIFFFHFYFNLCVANFVSDAVFYFLDLWVRNYFILSRKKKGAICIWICAQITAKPLWIPRIPSLWCGLERKLS